MAVTIQVKSPGLRPAVVEGPKAALERVVLAIVAVGPMLLLPVAAYLFMKMNTFVWWVDLPLLVTFHYWRGLGVTLLFHRQLTHSKGFWLHPWVRMFFMIGGHLAIQTDGEAWGTVHRAHHVDSDGDNDPHSPWKFVRERGLERGDKGYWKAVAEGLLWAHMGWMMRSWTPDERMYKGFREDSQLQWCRRHYGSLVLFSYLGPLAIAAALKSILLMNGSWNMDQFLAGVLFTGLVGGVIDIWITHHFTWAVNSLGHTFGVRPFVKRGTDLSTDLPFWEFGLPGKSLAIYITAITNGEPYHGGHHAFDWSPKHALAWKYHVDVTWYVIRFLAFLGLARVKLPDEEMIRKQLVVGWSYI